MGETADIPEANSATPVWRTPLAAVLVAWMGIVIGMTFAAPRLAETLPPGGALLLLATVYAVPPPLLLAWSFWTMLREPMTGWLAPTVLMAFLGGFTPLFGPLLDLGVRMNFAAHRPVYEAVVADAKAGRLRPDGDGWVEGVREGVRFRYRAERPRVVEFPWSRDPLVDAGVRYNAIPCTPSPTLKCLDRGQALGGDYFFYASLI